MADEYLQQLVENTDPKGTDFVPVSDATSGKLQKLKYSRIGLETQASTPDANITGEVGVLDIITMTSMTADRDYILPATAAVGERAGVMVVDGDDTYAILVKTGGAGDKINNVDHSSTEFTSLDVAGAIRVFRCIDAAGPHWVSEIAGEDATAIHTDTAGEINSLTEKSAPNIGDWGILEDSEDSNNKKKYQLGNAPGSGGGALELIELANITFSGESSVDVNVTGYESVVVIWENVTFSSAGGLAARISDDGVTFDSGATDYRTNRLDEGANTSGDDGEMLLYPKDVTATGNFGIATFFNISSASHRTRVEAFAGNEAGTTPNAIRHSYFKTARADTYIRIFELSAFTIDSGTLRVLGVGASQSSTGQEVKRCRARPAADLTTINATPGYKIPLDSEDFDIGTWHDNVTNNTRLTVPADAKDKVDIVAYLRASNVTADVYGIIRIFKDGVAYRRTQQETGLSIIEGGLTLLNESVVPGTTYYELEFLILSDTSITIETETSLMVQESTTTHGTNAALIPRPSTPDANIQGTVGHIDIITTTSMTANRDYLLPAIASVGDRCGVHCVNDEPDHEILIKTGSTSDQIDGTDYSTNELTRLFIAGESMEFECISAAGPHWRTVKDGRKSGKDMVYLNAVSPSLSAATYTAWSAFDTNGVTQPFNVGGLINATDGRATIRRDGIYDITCFARLNDNLVDGQSCFQRVRVDPDGTPIVILIGGESVGAGSNNNAPVSGKVFLLAGDVLEMEVQRQNAGTLFGGANIQASSTSWSITEQL